MTSGDEQSEENKAAVRACSQTGADGNLEALDGIMSARFVLHDPSSPEDVHGVEGMIVEEWEASDVSGLPQRIAALSEMAAS